MRAKKFSKRMLALLLSVIMVAEPASGSMVARAAEPDASQVMLGEETDSKEENKEENKKSSGSIEEGDISDDQESGESGAENQDEEKENPADQDKDNHDEENPSENDSEEESIGEDQEKEDNQDVSISGNEIDGDETEEGEDRSDKFSAMPFGYRLTSEQKEMKSALSASMGQFDESQEGKAYVARQVFAFADTREEAEAIAEAYHAELIEYDEGVVVLKLTEDTSVGEALCMAADLDNNLPAVYPDYYRYAHEEELPQENASITVVEEEYELVGNASEAVLSEEPTLEAYSQAVEAIGDPNMDYKSDYYQWQHVNVGSVYAWVAGPKGAGVTVAVLDTGVSAGNEVNVTQNINTSGASSGAKDVDGHGTHVAGIIAAKLNNSGGAGIAPEASIVNVKVLGDNGSGKDSDIIQGINAAMDAKVDIMNMSLGGIGYNPAVKLVIDKAYDAGIAIFVSAGNDGGNNMCYPAALDNVICVGAVDNNNQRAFFSNYGPWVDLSAPGVGIWSIGIDPSENEGYDCMSGTSQASPVAAGEAAVILSAKLSDIEGKTGPDKVNALKSIMQSNTVSAGSGMGKGVTSLTKVFKLTTAATKPNPPTITFDDTSNDTAQSMDIFIEVQAGMKICYTTNGKNPVFKNGEAGAGTELVENNTVTVPVNGANAAKGTVKAIAVNASGVVSAVKSYTYTLKPYVKTITVSGPTRVEKGKSIQLTAAVTPTYATDKTVTWELKTVADGEVVADQIKIDPKKGKITTTDMAVVGTKYKVIVTAQDNKVNPTTAEHSIEIVDANTAIQKIAFDKEVKKELWLGVKASAEPENTVSLFNYVTAEEKTADGKKTQPITNKEELAKHLVWTSSKPTVAEVDSKTGEVIAKAVGTTTITVKADDNLAKKATVNITVKQAVTRITITTDKGETAFTVAAGKSIALKANIKPDKPTNNKLNWSIAPDTTAGNTASADDMKNITINKTNGKITTKANVVSGDYIVTAEAADGKGEKATTKVTVVKGAIGEIKLDQTKTTLYTTAAGGDTTTTITATITGVKDKKSGVEGEFDPNAYMFTNSNPSVVTVTETASVGGKVTLKLQSTETMFGKANIVIASTDGSNKKATCAVTVSGGISKVEIVDAPSGTKKVSKLTLFRTGTAVTAPNTAEVYVKITNSKGANVKAYDVTSNNPLVEVTSIDRNTGKVTLKTSEIATGKATITAMATDGSKKKATCTVTVVNPVSKVNIAVKGSNSSYIAKGKTLQLQASLESEYGVVSNKKVTWSLDKYAKNITIDSSGKITAKKDATGSGTNSNQVTVTAAACDGSNVKATYNVYITDPIGGLYLWRYVNHPLYGTFEYPLDTKYTYTLEQIVQTENQDKNDTEELGGAYKLYVAWEKGNSLSGGVVVSSSNPKVMSATAGAEIGSDGKPTGRLAVWLSADNLGSATITIKAIDGGGAQVKYKFMVVEPELNE